MEWQEHLPRLRCVEHATYVGSAEENIDRSGCLAQGEFVWLLGDDDAMQGPIFIYCFRRSVFRSHGT